MLQAKLVVVGGEAKSKEVRLRLPAIIGRGPEATLTVPHALVSRVHCQITERDGRLFVKDLGSLNGTFIDNFRIDGEQPLMPDQLLTLGTITFRACYELNRAEVLSPETSAAAELAPVLKPETVSIPKRHVVTAQTVAATLLPPAQRLTERCEESTNLPPRVAPLAALEGEGTLNAAPQTNGAVEPHGEEAAKPVVDHALESDIANQVRIELEHPLAAEKSICLEALENLPGELPSLSFHHPIVVGNESETPPAGISSFHVLADEPAQTPVEVQDQALDSFLKKLPR
ncbi:MAG TPA: FHA domain-containing protein [Pirellulaceae bacterium]|nr:FHA domain-containing protein [Pirellulaceae bacterium]